MFIRRYRGKLWLDDNNSGGTTGNPAPAQTGGQNSAPPAPAPAPAAPPALTQADIDRAVQEQLNRLLPERAQQAKRSRDQEYAAALKQLGIEIEDGKDPLGAVSETIAKREQAAKAELEKRGELQKVLEIERAAAAKATTERDALIADLKRERATEKKRAAIVQAASDANAVDPSDVFLLLERSVEFDEQTGQLVVLGEQGQRLATSVKDHVAAWLQTKPHHVRAAGGTGGNSSPPNRPPGPPGGGNGNNSGPEEQFDVERYKTDPAYQAKWTPIITKDLGLKVS